LAEHAALGERLGVEALPTTVILSPQGDLLAKNPGYLPAGKYRQLLETGLAKHEKQAAAREIQQVSGDVPLEKPTRKR
jgi:thioredoxin-related protein